MEDQDQGVWDSIVTAFEDVVDQVIDATPRVLAAVAILLVGVIVAGIVRRIVKRLFKSLEKQRHIKKALASMGVAANLSRLMGKFAYWIVLAIFISVSVNVLALENLSETIDGIIAYAPALIGAAALAGVAFIGSQILRDLTESTLNQFKAPGARAIGIGVQVFILVFGITTALAQLGLDITLITNNLTVLLAGLVLALALAFGFGGKKTASSYLNYLTVGPQVEVGQKVVVDGMSGKVKEVKQTSVVVETKDGDMIVSYDTLIR